MQVFSRGMVDKGKVWISLFKFLLMIGIVEDLFKICN